MSTGSPSALEAFESLKWAFGLGVSSESNQIRFVEVGGVKSVVLPQGATIESLEGFSAAPYRINEKAQFVDADSFAEYVSRFVTEDTLLFGSLGRKEVVARLDYHGKDKPRWQGHTATLLSVFTPEWSALRAVNGNELSQTELADWLETYDHIVIEPDAAKLCEVAMNLQGSVNGQFQARIVRSNGSATFSYSEETVTNQVVVPTRISIQAAPFAHSTAIAVNVQFRFRIADGRPRFKLVIPTIEREEQVALQEAFEAVSNKTNLTVLVGP